MPCGVPCLATDLKQIEQALASIYWFSGDVVKVAKR